MHTKNPQSTYEKFLESVIDTIRESILILDKDLRVISANKTFYDLFKVDKKDTERKCIYELGNGQWNIPDLKKLLEDILPSHNPFNDFRVEHDFPKIGKKVMLLNARQMKENGDWQDRILLAMEDITKFDKDRQERDAGIERERTVTNELKTKQVLLQKSEEQYKLLFNSIDEGFCIIEILFDNKNNPIDYLFLETNKVFEQQTGLKNPVGKRARELVPNLEKHWLELYGKVAATGKALRFVEKSEAMGRWFSVYAARIGKQQSRKIAVLFSDITKQKNMEEELRGSEEYFRKMADSVPVVIWITDTKGYCVYLNEHWYTFTGQSREEAKGYGWLQAVHPDDANHSKKVFLDANKKHTPFSLEYRLMSKQGKFHWAIDTGIPRFNSQGNFVGYVGTVVDIHERKLAEEALKDSIDRQNIMLQATNLGLWYCDLPFDELIWDDKVKEHFWLPKNAHVTIDDFYSIIHPEDRERTRNAIESSINNHTSYDVEYRTVNSKTKDVKWIRAIGRTFYDKNTPIRFDGVTLDISDYKFLAKQKDEFLGIASHELKTPVTSIKAYGQVLQTMFRRKGDVKAVEALQKMDAQVNKLTNLIGDLLDVTKIQSGRLEFHESYFDFNEFVTDVVDEMQLTTERHTLVKSLSKTKSILGDRERIGQVLINLISNAIKYSPHSKDIIISTKADKKHVTVCVQDFGVGIPKKKQERVFEQFFRVSSPQHSTVPGLGLGLYISSEIIKRQGGRIWVESVEGKGSTFCFSLPYSKKKTIAKNNLVDEEIEHE